MLKGTMSSVIETTAIIGSGYFINDSFIRLEYRNENRSIIQFGNAIVHLSGNGRTICGHLAGYSHSFETLVWSDVTINKT